MKEGIRRRRNRITVIINRIRGVRISRISKSRRGIRRVKGRNEKRVNCPVSN